jgi:hypothetical protein
MPATVATGDLLVMLIAVRVSTGAITTPSGWNLRGSQTGGSQTCLVYDRVSDGTEGGTNVNVATFNTGRSSAHVLRYQAGTYAGTSEMTVSYNASTASPDSPSISPSGGAGDYQVTAFWGLNGAPTVSVYAYPDNQFYDATTNMTAASSSDDLTGSSFDPPAGTISAAIQVVQVTVAVKGV